MFCSMAISYSVISSSITLTSSVLPFFIASCRHNDRAREHGFSDVVIVHYRYFVAIFIKSSFENISSPSFLPGRGMSRISMLPHRIRASAI